MINSEEKKPKRRRIVADKTPVATSNAKKVNTLVSVAEEVSRMDKSAEEEPMPTMSVAPTPEDDFLPMPAGDTFQFTMTNAPSAPAEPESAPKKRRTTTKKTEKQPEISQPTADDIS